MVFVDVTALRPSAPRAGKAPSSVSLRGDDVFEAASLVKIPILIEVFSQAAERRLSLTERMTVTDADITSGSGILKSRPPGGRYTIRQLAEWMITISDNTATDMLARRVGPAHVNARMTALGLSRTRLRRKIMDFAAIDRGLDNQTTPAEMARLLARLAAGRIVNRSSSEAMLGILTRQKRRHIIAAALPRGTWVASKTGELSGIIHDVALVGAPRRTYVLCLLGGDVRDAEAARAAFRRVSLQVYQVVQKGEE